MQYYIIRPIFSDDKDMLFNATGQVKATANSFGTKLVGLIYCSDSFGVDLLVENYLDALESNAQKDKDKYKAFFNQGPERYEPPAAEFDSHTSSVNNEMSRVPTPTGLADAIKQGHEKNKESREFSDSLFFGD